MDTNYLSAAFPLFCAVLYVSFHYVFGTKECQGIDGVRCCAGYKWDQETRTCVKCNIGYKGKDCEIPCPYPSFGEDCQELCACSQELCHPAYGCVQPKCRKGYTGRLCVDRCPYPKYGIDCSGTCDCEESKCRFEDGCIRSKLTLIDEITTPLRTQNQNNIQSKDNTTTEKNDKSTNSRSDSSCNGYIKKTTFLIIIITLIFVFILVCVVIFGLFKRRLQQTSGSKIHYHDINEAEMANASSLYDPSAKIVAEVTNPSVVLVKDYDSQKSNYSSKYTEVDVADTASIDKKPCSDQFVQGAEYLTPIQTTKI